MKRKIKNIAEKQVINNISRAKGKEILENGDIKNLSEKISIQHYIYKDLKKTLFYIIICISVLFSIKFFNLL